MPGSREDPNVAFQIGQKLNVDVRLIGGHEVSESAHGILRVELRADLAQRIASAGSDHAVIGIETTQTPLADVRERLKQAKP